MKDKTLPESNASYTGGTNGSMGEATMADLKRGYTKPAPESSDDQPMFYPETEGGFVGRPKGWER